MNSDEATERVLVGLASVEAPPAMERRVLQVVQHRAETREATSSPWFRTRPWAVAANLLVLAIAGSIAVRSRQEPTHREAVLNRHTLPMPAVEVAATRPVARPMEVSLPTTSRKAKTTEPVALSDMEALAIEEMNAPSKPAPPLPLTHQEELLAEAAHPNSAVELSSLRPEIRARQMEISKAEFHNFFEPPPPKDNE